MSYRDENEALRARVEHLEGALADANSKIARLTGSEIVPSEGTEVVTSSVTGGPLRASFARDLPFEVTTAGYEAIAELVRERTQAQVAQVGRTLAAPRFSLRCADGKTSVRLLSNWSSGLAGMAAAPLISALLLGVPGLAALMALTHGRLGAGPLVAAIWLVTVMAAGAAAMRSLVRRAAERALASDRGLFESVLALAEKHALRSEPVQVRVDATTADDEELGDARPNRPRASSGRPRNP